PSLQCVSSPQSRPLDTKRMAKLLDNGNENQAYDCTLVFTMRVYSTQSLSSEKGFTGLATHHIFSMHRDLHVHGRIYKRTGVLLLFHWAKITTFPRHGLRNILHMVIIYLIPNSGFCQSFPSLACF
uniref:Uncharacterized protein n=1 Tax=Acanthochromis polyacanthus TaxID=80966 RepID=A0A3Q1G3G9_9TELE